MDDALELLSPEFKNRDVRAYAVSQLQHATDDELELYLLQLVQAIKFDASGKTLSDSASVHSHNSWRSSSAAMFESCLADFLITRAVNNPVLGNYFYWY